MKIRKCKYQKIAAFEQFPYFCSLILNHVMKNFYKKICSLFLLLSFATIVFAQSLSYKTLSLELQSLQKQFVPDKRVAILEIELKDTLQPTIVISGTTDQRDIKMRILQYLRDQKISFIDSIRILPDSSLSDKTWALATLSVSNLRLQPNDASELVSQVPMGTPMKVLDFNHGWYRVQTPELYIGWMDASGLQRITQNELNCWKGSTRYLYNRMSGYGNDAPGKKGKIVTDLVLDDLFEVEAEEKGFFKIKIPDGRTAFVRKNDCISWKEWSERQPDVKSLISVAQQMQGSPYLWGGASSKAADCSGFVKLAYYSQGIILARDASQQARYGESIDFNNWSNLQPGDLLFFGRSAQRISHVGIYLGNGDFIHSSGRVHISSIDPNDPKYVVTRKNVAARRILNSLNSEGIVRVKNHPWY
jgi:gamma-D-glutamyl-L-lysine dipeptidyl-peptidase